MRMALVLQYDGHRYAGWQYQKHSPSIQERVEAALSEIAGHPVRTVAAGRTDAGVHATFQVVHFDTTARRPEKAWVLGGNTHLPEDIRILWAREVPESFHAQRQALARHYRYRILNRPVACPFRRHQVTWFPHPLDLEAMRQGASFLLGEHDFSSFRGPYCQSRSPYRRVYLIELSRQGDEVVLDIVANAYLHNMVRIIAGTLLAVGSGKYPPKWVEEVLLARRRVLGAVTAPPDGLYLAGVLYPERFGLPRPEIAGKLPRDLRRIEGEWQLCRPESRSAV